MALALLLGFLALAPVFQATPAAALSSTTITIDGDFDDWAGVRADPDNTVVDTQIPNDPDWPGQADRDLYYVNYTYDDEYLYFAWRRTAGGTKAITFGAYIDLDGDGLLQDTDRVVVWTVSTGNPYDSQGNILHYNQAYTEGDPMDDWGPPPTDQQNPVDPDWANYTHDSPNGDGATPDGWARWQDGEDTPIETMDAYLAEGDGIEAEAKVAWSDLGFGAGTDLPPDINFHFASGNGETWGTKNKTSAWPDDYNEVSGQLEEQNHGQVEDNIKGTGTLRFRDVTLTPDRYSGASEGTTVTYSHTLTNSGNATDTFSLEAASSQGWTVWYELPDGSTPATLSLGADESTTVVVYVRVPSGTAAGTQDLTTLTAESTSDDDITDTVTDTTYVGDVTVSPNNAASMAPSKVVTYTHTITNFQGTTATYSVTATSTLGWTTAVFDDDWNPLSSVTLASGESTTVVVTVLVPAVGVGEETVLVDVTKVRATDTNNPAIWDEAEDVTTRKAGIEITPDNTGYGGAGAVVSYAHEVTNSYPTTRSIELTATSSQGWPIKIFASDGVTEITSVTVGPNGSTEDIWVRIFVPDTATTSDVDTTTVTASVPGKSDTATDVTTITSLTTYDSPGYGTQEDEFVLGDTIYARGTGLGGYSEVFFVWYDDDGNVVRTSSDLEVDTQGMQFDQYSTVESDTVGSWTVKLFEAGDDPDVDTPIEVSYFTVSYDAEITYLNATDAPSIGTSTTIDCTVENSNNLTITASTISYVIWWDDDGDGVFSTGDTYMDSTGAPQTWDGSSEATSHVSIGNDVGPDAEYDDATWEMSNVQFPNQGVYNVTATWTDQDDNVIDIATTQFFSVPTLGWPLFLLAAFVGMAFLWRRARIPGAFAPQGVTAA